jgi:hypothetical protein
LPDLARIPVGAAMGAARDASYAAAQISVASMKVHKVRRMMVPFCSSRRGQKLGI